MIVVPLTGDGPRCDDCGQLAREFVFEHQEWIGDRLIQSNLVRPCHCKLNVVDVTETSPPRRPPRTLRWRLEREPA